MCISHNWAIVGHLVPYGLLRLWRVMLSLGANLGVAVWCLWAVGITCSNGGREGQQLGGGLAEVSQVIRLQ